MINQNISPGRKSVVSGEREWPVTGFRYICSTGHWVISRRGDLADTACPAKFGNYTVMLGDSVLCGGTLGDPLVDGSEASDEINRLRATLQLVVDQLDEGFPKSAQQIAMDALGEHLKEARRG